MPTTSARLGGLWAPTTLAAAAMLNCKSDMSRHLFFSPSVVEAQKHPRGGTAVSGARGKKHLERCCEVGREGASLHMERFESQHRGLRGRGFWGEGGLQQQQSAGRNETVFQIKGKKHPNQPTNQPTKKTKSEVRFRTEAARGTHRRQSGCVVEQWLLSAPLIRTVTREGSFSEKGQLEKKNGKRTAPSQQDNAWGTGDSHSSRDPSLLPHFGTPRLIHAVLLNDSSPQSGVPPSCQEHRNRKERKSERESEAESSQSSSEKSKEKLTSN
ncbi:uncharacterized protein LOC125684085 [Lagopus muta]|uniref:uncharacterized protein LOC125684085 n=1 Tax=Lagopus muta TaxID=64668 RepID=UPI00209E685D|nr:uncharacterized protein LOC125684085 [Lagopus muta]